MLRKWIFQYNFSDTMLVTKEVMRTLRLEIQQITELVNLLILRLNFKIGKQEIVCY